MQITILEESKNVGKVVSAFSDRCLMHLGYFTTHMLVFLLYFCWHMVSFQLCYKEQT